MVLMREIIRRGEQAIAPLREEALVGPALLAILCCGADLEGSCPVRSLIEERTTGRVCGVEERLARSVDLKGAWEQARVVGREWWKQPGSSPKHSGPRG